jgi:hypothetical protein
MVSVAPFLFLGLIEGIKVDKDKIPKNLERKNLKKVAYSIHRNISKRKEPIVVFIFVILFAIIFQPYSPVNSYTASPFQMNILHPNMELYGEYKNITNLIPKNNPYVIYQKNLPYVDVHDPSLSCTAAFYSNCGFNAQLSYELMNLTKTTNIDYAMAYEKEFSTGKQLTMCQAINKLYSTGEYGMEAYEDGLILISKGYAGSPIYFKPINLTYSSLTFQGNNNKSTIQVQPCLLIPGHYEFNISFPIGVSSTNISSIYIDSSHLNLTYINPIVKTTKLHNIYTDHIILNLSSFTSEPVISIIFEKLPYNTSIGTTIAQLKQFS